MIVMTARRAMRAMIAMIARRVMRVMRVMREMREMSEPEQTNNKPSYFQVCYFSIPSYTYIKLWFLALISERTHLVLA